MERCALHWFLGAFAKFHKETISFVCLSAWNNSDPMNGFFMKFDIEYFSKLYRGNTSFIKICEERRSLYMNTGIRFWSYLAQLLVKWEVFQRKIVQEIKTHISCSVTFFFSPSRKLCCSWDFVEKDDKAGQATDDNMWHAHCMLDN